MQRIAFSSDMLPAGLDDRSRLSAWHDSVAPVGSFDVSYISGKRFFARTQYLRGRNVALLDFDGTIGRLRRTARHIASDGDDCLSLVFNAGSLPWSLSQRRSEAVLRPGMVTFCNHAEPCDYRSNTAGAWIGLGVPPSELLPLVPGAEDLVNRPLDPNAPAMRHMRRYLALVLGPEGIGADEDLDNHVGRTLLDLMVLALGAGHDATELARSRGLRAARQQAVLHEIKTNFAEPACTAQRTALKLGFSVRYVHHLLHETGASFTDRVIELRLQRARAMLSSPHYDHLKVIEIAGRCGFNEVSHFNRCFRRRFGASPMQYRGGTGDG